jgi:signal transduction histidine kinase
VDAPPDTLDAARLRRLIDAGSSLVAQLDLETVLDELLAIATELTGARYAALGILDERRLELERFLTRGVDEATHRAIGDLPRGRGILGVLIEDPRPLRLASVRDDPRSYGFPPGHPQMETFLGVPIVIRGEAWGNLYLTEKAGRSEFTEGDEQSAVVLAAWAAIAIDNARLYEDVQSRRDELERAVRRYEATTAIARAVGGETDLDRVLELIVKRGRALVDARGLVILLREEDGLHVAATAGEVPDGVPGARLPLEDNPAAEVLRSGRPERFASGGRAPLEALGVSARSALLVPLVFRGQTLGLLAAFERRGDAEGFEAEDERLLLAFAASAATAVATARSVEQQRLRDALAAAESERRRWARELHDETLQGLGALRMMLSGARRRAAGDDLRDAVERAVEHIDDEIESLRTLIRELRPAALDELGAGPAIEELAARMSARHGIEIATRVALAGGGRSPELDTVVYRVVQEALTNAVKHAGARRADVTVTQDAEAVHIEVADDGRGFDPEGAHDGFGLVGMRERVALLDGELEVASSAGGTRVAAALPLGH